MNVNVGLHALRYSDLLLWSHTILRFQLTIRARSTNTAVRLNVDHTVIHVSPVTRVRSLLSQDSNVGSKPPSVRERTFASTYEPNIPTEGTGERKLVYFSSLLNIQIH